MTSECPNGPTQAPFPSERFARQLVDLGIAVNSGNMERFARDLPTLTRGFSKVELMEIYGHPRQWAWGVDFNGGNYLNSRLPELGHKKQAFLNQKLQAGIVRNISPHIDTIAFRLPAVPEPAPQEKTSKNKKRKGKADNKNSSSTKSNQPDKYAGPIAMAVKFADAGNMDEIIRQQSLGINVAAGIHLIPVTNTTRSHAVGCARANQYECNTETVTDMVTTLKLSLNMDEKFHRLVSSVIMGPEPTIDKVRAITDFIRLVPLPTKVTINHIDWDAFCLFAPVTSRADDPFVRDRDENRIRDYIRSVREFSHTYLKVYVEPMECTLCKCDTHYTFHCPFTSLDAWNGPRDQVAAAVATYIKNGRS
ncbi:hypothetical protein EV360DRAFT_74875 [Lentinula raphanica]|nr:hypothetical protein EV360DRAFT_74875 [Lentinula raphanica]